MINIDLHTLQSELNAAGRGARGSVIKRYAALYGVSRDTIYRMLRREYGKTKTVERKKKIDQTLINAVARLKITGMNLGAISTNKRNPRELPTDIAIDLLKNEYGICEAEDLTVSTVNRRLRESGFRTPDPKIRVECEYANQEHQLDFSRSKYFQIVEFDPEKNDWILKVSGKELHYKKGDRNFRLWIAQLKDSYSRARLARAYGATGESAIMGLEFLNFCYTRKEDDHPLNYIPDTLKTDQGAFAKKKEVQAVMRALQIELKKSTPWNKESQGKIESGFVTIWRRFEMRLAMKLGGGAKLYLSQYNQLLHEFMIKDLDQKHTVRTQYKRGEDYRVSMIEHPPREIDESLFIHAFRTYERTVDQTLMVTIDNIPLACPDYTIGQRIRIYRNMNGEYEGELMREDRKSFTLQPYHTYKPGEFEHRPHATYRQKMEVEARQLEKERLATKDRSEDWKQFKQSIQPVIEQEAASPFNETTSKNFETEREARLYIGKRLPKGKTFTDYEDLFMPLIKKELNKKAVDMIIEQIAIYEQVSIQKY